MKTEKHNRPIACSTVVPHCGTMADVKPVSSLGLRLIDRWTNGLLGLNRSAKSRFVTVQPFSLLTSLLILSILFIPVNSAFSALVFDSPTVEIPPNPSLTEWVADYSFKNTGTKLVTITQIRPCCDCTRSKINKNTFAPNESGKFSLIFKTEGKSGLQEKHAVITTDDGEKPQVIYLKGTIPSVYDYVTLSTQSLRWEKGEERKPKTIKVTWKKGSKTKIISTHLTDGKKVSIDSNESNLDVKWSSIPSEKEDEPSRVRLKVRPNKKLIPDPELFFKVQYEIISEDQSLITVTPSFEKYFSVLKVKTDCAFDSISTFEINLGAF